MGVSLPHRLLVGRGSFASAHRLLYHLVVRDSYGARMLARSRSPRQSPRCKAAARLGEPRIDPAPSSRTRRRRRTPRPVTVNAGPLAAPPTGRGGLPTRRATRARFYSVRPQAALTASVPWFPFPTGIAPTRAGASARGGGHSDPARFIYACRTAASAWTPTHLRLVDAAEIVVDHAAQAAIFGGVALTHGRLYATDFHNDRVEVFDRNCGVRPPHAFVDATSQRGTHCRHSRCGQPHFRDVHFRAPVNGDAPRRLCVDEPDLDGCRSRASPIACRDPGKRPLRPDATAALARCELRQRSHRRVQPDRHGWWHDGPQAPTASRSSSTACGDRIGNGATAGSRRRRSRPEAPPLAGASELQVHGLLAEIARNSRSTAAEEHDSAIVTMIHPTTVRT